MSNWAKALAWYQSQIGFREGPNNANPYAAEVRARVQWEVPGWWANTPYCGIFVMAGHLVGGGTIPGTGVRSEYCPTAVNNWKAAGRWGEYPRVGAWVYFRNGRGVWYHVGVVESFDDTHITTIEANTFADGSSGSGNGVYRKRHRRRDAYVGGYGYPAYVSSPQPEPVQQLLEDDDMGFLVQYSHGPDQPVGLWFLLSNDLTTKTHVKDEATLNNLKASGVKVVPMSKEQLDNAVWGGMDGFTSGEDVAAASSNPRIEQILRAAGLLA